MGYSHVDRTHVMIEAEIPSVSTWRKLMWRCPGCRDVHAVGVGGDSASGMGWTWNGSMTAPTFSPSILKSGGAGPTCHSFVRDGMVEFLADCGHELAGQSVRMLPEDAHPFRLFGEEFEPITVSTPIPDQD